MNLNLGEMFQVCEVADLMDGDIVVCRYRPGLGYRVTSRNVVLVNELAAQGIASAFEGAGLREAAKTKVSGTARVL